MRRDRTLLTLVVALLTGCRMAPVPVTDDAVSLRSRLIRIEDTRRVESAVLDSALRASDPSMRRAAALAAGRVGARTLQPPVSPHTSQSDTPVAGAA